jgi:hypothetical protein
MTNFHSLAEPESELGRNIHRNRLWSLCSIPAGPVASRRWADALRSFADSNLVLLPSLCGCFGEQLLEEVALLEEFENTGCQVSARIRVGRKMNAGDFTIFTYSCGQREEGRAHCLSHRLLEKAAEAVCDQMRLKRVITWV